MSELRQREGDQALPLPGTGPLMHDLLVADLKRTFPTSSVLSALCADVKARQELGIQRYGRPLQAHNGRDALRDGYEEILDFLVYALQGITETGLGSVSTRRLVNITWAYDEALRIARTYKELIAERDAGL